MSQKDIASLVLLLNLPGRRFFNNVYCVQESPRQVG